MPAGVPLSTLLSWLLVAYTVELDNEFERRMLSPGSYRAFRVSLVMWENFLRFVGPDGTPVRDVPALAGLTSKLHAYLALERWGYVTVDGTGTDRVVRPTRTGLRAIETWPPLPALVDERWRERFGEAAVAELRRRLEAVVDALGVDRPRYLPVVGYGMSVEVPPAERRRASADLGAGLSAPLSLVLLELTAEFEREADVSLPFYADVLRVIDEDGTPVPDLPVLSGVSREAMSIAVGGLERRGRVVVEPDPASARGRRVRLTARGRAVRDRSAPLLAEVEARWRTRFGADAIDGLRAALEGIACQGARLAEGLVPPADGWRAGRPYSTRMAAWLEDCPARLPHQPMVTHRGGWPDGS